jgi:hypothetical protein
VDSKVGGPSLNRVSQDNRNNSVMEPGKKEWRKERFPHSS